MYTFFVSGDCIKCTHFFVSGDCIKCTHFLSVEIVLSEDIFVSDDCTKWRCFGC